MNLEFSEDQKFVQQTARDYLNEYASPEVCRAVMESDKPYDADLWKGVAEMGWLGATVPEEFGGAGLGYLELVLIAEELGRALAPIPFSSSVYLATEALLIAGSEEQKQKYLPPAVLGRTDRHLRLRRRSRGSRDRCSWPRAYADGKLNGEKIPVLDGDAAGLAAVLARKQRRAIPRARRSGGGGSHAHGARVLRSEPFPGEDQLLRRTRRAAR